MTQYKNITTPIPSIDPSIQQAITEIGGRNIDGEPILRLEWGGTETKWPNGPLKFWSHKTIEGYHGIPRWYLSKHWSFEQVCPEGLAWWESNRYSSYKEEEEGVPLGTDLLGPPPLRGQYRCEMMLPDGYRPDSQLVDYLRYLKAQRDAAPDQSAMTEEQRIAAIQKGIQADEDAVAAEKAAQREEFRESLASDLMPMRARLGRPAARQLRGAHRWYRRGPDYDPNYVQPKSNFQWGHLPKPTDPEQPQIIIPTDEEVKQHG